MSSLQQASAAARRYARALAELAEEGGVEDTVHADLQSLRAAIEVSPELARFVASPLHGPQRQRAVVEALAQKMKLHDLVRRFLAVLIGNRRLALLPQVIAAFEQLQAERRGEVRVRAITAEPLGAAQRRKLEAALNKTLGRAVDIDNAVDPDILGGLVLRIGSRMIDASVRQRLNALKGVLKGV